MIYKQKNRNGELRGNYRVRFKWQGQIIDRSTLARDKKTAKTIESQIRAELAKGRWEILEPKPKPILSDFLRDDFEPYVETKHAAKPKTMDYYKDGIGMLVKGDIARLRLDEVTDQHAQQFAAKHSDSLAVSTINCPLRTLRRALKLAEQWGKVDRAPKITLLKGERQRDRVLTEAEWQRYNAACSQPWRDVATIIHYMGYRPSEVYGLTWQQVWFSDNGSGLIKILDGKSRAARRTLPMVPEVFNVLWPRFLEQKRPTEGWVFPSGAVCGHFEEGTAKTQHARALRTINDEAKKKELPELKPFEPYCLRHTALTRLAESGCDAFTLARIAGHSSITITQRYCHPQADAIERAFQNLKGRSVVRAGGDTQKRLRKAKTRKREVSDWNDET